MRYTIAALTLSAVLVGLLPGVAGAELCEKCKGKMFIASVGRCVECAGFTSSGAHKLCRNCSAKLGECEHCRAKLKTAERQADAKTKPYLRAIELDDSDNGKTISAFVGQRIIIRVKSNPSTGYAWSVRKLEGDAIEQVGKVGYDSDVPARLGLGGPRHPSMHRIGGGGRSVFTYRAAKAGKVVLTLEYKGPGRVKVIAKTFKLIVNVKAAPAGKLDDAQTP